MQRSIISVAVAVLCTGWMILSAQPAASQAQSPTPQAKPAAPQAPSANVSDQKLDQAAAAIQSVQTVQTTYRQKLSTASPEQKDKIVREANAALVKAVTDQGLSPDEYNSIIEVAQNDPGVRERLVKRLAAAKKQ